MVIFLPCLSLSLSLPLSLSLSKCDYLSTGEEVTDSNSASHASSTGFAANASSISQGSVVVSVVHIARDVTRDITCISCLSV